MTSKVKDPGHKVTWYVWLVWAILRNGTLTKYEDAYDRQSLWPPRSKIKVISSHRLYVSSLPFLNSGKMLYLCQLEAGRPAGAYCSEPGGHAHFLLLTKFINAIVVCKLLLACGHVQYDLSIHETNTSSDTSDPNSSQSKFQQATVPCIHRHTRSVGVRHICNTVFKAVKALWNLQWVSGRSVVTCRTFLVFMWSKSNHFEGRTDRPTDGRTHRYKRDALQNSTRPAGTVQGVIFRENSQKVDEHFSQFFVKNFTETKESRFGNFFSWKFAQNSLDDFAIFRENTQQLR